MYYFLLDLFLLINYEACNRIKLKHLQISHTIFKYWKNKKQNLKITNIKISRSRAVNQNKKNNNVHRVVEKSRKRELRVESFFMWKLKGVK